MDKLLYRPSEAAELLGVGRSRIYTMLAAGELPSVRVGRSVRVPVTGLRRWVEAQVAEPLVSVGRIEAAPPLE